MEADSEVTRLFLVISSKSSFVEIKGVPSAVWAIRGLRKTWQKEPLYICATRGETLLIERLLKQFNIDGEVTYFDFFSPQNLASEILKVSGSQDIAIIQDASRPLVSSVSCDAIVAALDRNVDAVRPAIPFTETLKYVNEERVIEETLDRTTVKRVSSPQLIRVCAIVQHGKNSSWFVPLRADAKIIYVEGNSMDVRIEGSDEVDLFESYMRLRKVSLG